MKNKKKSVSNPPPTADSAQRRRPDALASSADDGADEAPETTRPGHPMPASQVDDDSLFGDEPPVPDDHDPVLFTNSALRLHLPHTLPPTPGKQPPLRRRILGRIRRLMRRRR